MISDFRSMEFFTEKQNHRISVLLEAACSDLRSHSVLYVQRLKLLLHLIFSRRHLLEKTLSSDEDEESSHATEDEQIVSR